MRSLVVLFAMIAASLAAPQYLVQQAYSPTVVLDAVDPALHYQVEALHGHLLKKRSVVPVAYSVPSAVSHQSRVDVHTSPAVVETASVVAAPVVAEPAVVEARAVYAAPAAVSHQSRVDVRTSQNVVETAPVVAAPVVAEPAVVEARAVYAAPAAVSHQSRVDVRASPAVVTPVVAPVVASRALVAQPVVPRSYVPAATVYAGGSAVSHQSRVDVETSPAVVTQEVLAPAVIEARSVFAPSVYASTW